MAKSRYDNSIFEESLQMIPQILEWVETQDVERLRKFLVENSNIPLYCFSSGGASSSLHYVAMLYETNRGMAKALTPLMMASISDETLKNSKILIYSHSGSGCDEEYVITRAVQVNPKGLAALSRDNGEKNHLIDTAKGVTTNWFKYGWPEYKPSFISTVAPLAVMGLVYKAFTNDSDIVSKLAIDITPNACFTYGARKEGEIPPLNRVKHFIALHSGWSEPAAQDFECKMIESGIASVQLVDYRNFCHGRFVFVSAHLEETALVLFLTPRDRQFANNLILEGKTNKGGRELFPLNTPIIKIETELDNPLATIDLMIKMIVCFNQIAKACEIEPCKPKFSKIQHDVPRGRKFEGLLEMGALGSGTVQGSVGTLKKVGRKKPINYDPSMTIEELAKANEVEEPTIRKFIIDNRIDRMRDEKVRVYNDVWSEYIKDSDISNAALAKKLKMSVNTIKYYLGLKKAIEIKPKDGKIGMAIENDKIRSLRKSKLECQEKFERVRPIIERNPNITALEVLKKLNWSANVKENVNMVTSFLQMKEFKWKFEKGKLILIPND